MKHLPGPSFFSGRAVKLREISVIIFSSTQSAVVLLMVQKSGDHHLGCKIWINMGLLLGLPTSTGARLLNHQPYFFWIFWAIHSSDRHGFNLGIAIWWILNKKINLEHVCLFTRWGQTLFAKNHGNFPQGGWMILFFFFRKYFSVFATQKVPKPRCFARGNQFFQGLLGGGLKYFSFSPLPLEIIQFDYYFANGLKPPTRL